MNLAFLIFILKDTWLDDAVATGSLLVILTVFVLSIIEAIRSFKKVQIKFVTEEKSLLEDFGTTELENRIKDRMRTAVDNYQRASSTDGHIGLNRDFAFSLTPIFDQKTAEKISSSADKKFGPLQKLLNQIVVLLGRFLKPPQVLCKVYQQDKTISVSLEFQTKGLTSKAISYGEVVFNELTYDDFLDAIVTKMLYRLAGEKDTGILVEDAFHLFRIAFRAWPRGIYNNFQKGVFDEVKKYLLLALKLDKNSPLINYHLGVIDYYYYSYYPDDVKPIEYFRQAQIASKHLPRLNYLALIGECRYYCQSYHRFGDMSEKVRQDAIARAKKALAKINNERHVPKQDWCRVYYCLAFAHHVTENKDDIETGIRYYQKAINVYYPDFDIHIRENKDISYENVDRLGINPVLTVVYNNLGYILMAYHSRFDSVPEAAEYLKLAEEMVNWAVSSDSNYYLGYANLGNIQRLRKEFSWAISSYERTIELKGDYISGYAELAWVYKEKGDMDKAKEYLDKALKLAPNERRRNKIRKEFEKIGGKVVA